MRLRTGLRVLRRTATEVQVGTDPRWAVRLPGLTPAEADLLQAVDARTDLTEVARLVAGRDVDPSPAYLALLSTCPVDKSAEKTSRSCAAPQFGRVP